MKIVILSSLGNEIAQRCIVSLLENAPATDFDLHLIREKGFREQTLNYALEQIGTDDDTLFVGDDILFTPGWYTALMNHLDKADILGMTMLYPHSSEIQDRGYDLIGQEGKPLLVPKDRRMEKDSLKPFGFRLCDAVCGCFLYIKAEVFTHVNTFSEEGVNRWGEFIFIAQARKAGFKCGVIEHYLQHGGISTKNNPDKNLGSASYLVEHGWWKDIVRNYVDPQWVKSAPENKLGESLIQILSRRSTRGLFYGAGTVAEFILESMGENLATEIEFCSGLTEEVGMVFKDHTLQDVSTIDPTRFDFILMTPLHIGKDLFFKLIEPRLKADFQGSIFVVETLMNGQFLEFKAREIPVGA